MTNDIVQLLRERTGDAEFFQELGKLFSGHKMYDLAKLAYDASLELDPCDGFTHLYLGNWYYRRRQYECALERFEYAHELMPEMPAPLWCIADVFEAQGRFTEARDWHRRSTAADPSDKQARRKYREFRQRRRLDDAGNGR